jgi:hypothetical protein
MQKYEAQTLAQNLNSLAEVFDKKPVSAKALEVWFDTLKEFPTERVMGLLINWPKAHGKFPTPAEVWKACNESSMSERESKASAERQVNAGPIVWPKTQHAQDCLRRMREMLTKPKRTPMQHWEWVISRAPKGSTGHQYAVEALVDLRARAGITAREPGQDDEEMAA